MKHNYFLFVTSINFLLIIALNFTSLASELKGDLPRFEEYAISKTKFKYAKKVDLKSHPYAQNYKTFLTNGFKNRANFAGHLIIISHGCGTLCQVQWIVDAKDGKIKGRFETSLGAEYKLDSNLLILNSADKEMIQEYKKSPESYPPMLSTEKTIYMLWEGKKLKTLKTIDTLNYLKEI